MGNAIKLPREILLNLQHGIGASNLMLLLMNSRVEPTADQIDDIKGIMFQDKILGDEHWFDPWHSSLDEWHDLRSGISNLALQSFLTEESSNLQQAQLRLQAQQIQQAQKKNQEHTQNAVVSEIALFAVVQLFAFINLVHEKQIEKNEELESQIYKQKLQQVKLMSGSNQDMTLLPFRVNEPDPLLLQKNNYPAMSRELIKKQVQELESCRKDLLKFNQKFDEELQKLHAELSQHEDFTLSLQQLRGAIENTLSDGKPNKQERILQRLHIENGSSPESRKRLDSKLKPFCQKFIDGSKQLELRYDNATSELKNSLSCMLKLKIGEFPEEAFDLIAKVDPDCINDLRQPEMSIQASLDMLNNMLERNNLLEISPGSPRPRGPTDINPA